MECINYWEKRYKNDLNSGLGSRDKLSEYKIHFVNKIIQKRGISSIIDFGFGDSTISSQIVVDDYVGIDISDELLKNRDKYIAKNTTLYRCPFDQIDNLHLKNADLCICLDVLYHLSDEEYLAITLNKIQKYANKYIILYTKEYKANLSKKLTAHIFNYDWKKYLNKNIRLLTKTVPQVGSSANFFVFEKKEGC